ILVPYSTLFRSIQHAGTASGTLYSYVCHCPYRRMERSPYGRTDQYRQDHPPCIQKCSGRTALCIFGGTLSLTKSSGAVTIGFKEKKGTGRYAGEIFSR